MMFGNNEDTQGGSDGGGWGSKTSGPWDNLNIPWDLSEAFLVNSSKA